VVKIFFREEPVMFNGKMSWQAKLGDKKSENLKGGSVHPDSNEMVRK
jgi:hypothetical protein